jgi:hypothetical protein
MTSLVSLLEKCDTARTLDLPGLLADHCMRWHSRKETKKIAGIYSCDSMITWFTCAMAYLDLHPEGPSGQEKIPDFPLIEIPPFLTYSTKDYTACLSEMTMQEMMKTIEGLEWHVFSCPFRLTSSDAWWSQVKSMLDILTARAFFLSRGEFGTDVMNEPQYAEKFEVDYLEHLGISEVGGTTERRNDDDAAYRSEDEGGGDENDPPPEDVRRRKRVRRIMKFAEPIPDPANPDLEAVYGAESARPKQAIAYASRNYFHDIDSTLTQLWLFAFERDTAPVPRRAPHMDLYPFRKWIFALARQSKHSDIVEDRRKWYDELVTTESYIRVHLRKNPMDKNPAPRAVLISKHDKMHQQHCTSIEEVCDAQADDPMLRMNTDALFHILARSLEGKQGTGNIVKAVYRKTFMDVDGPLCIYRDPTRNVWIIYFSHTERYSASSFTAAFAFLRLKMKERDMNNLKNETDLSVWDEHFRYRGDDFATT